MRRRKLYRVEILHDYKEVYLNFVCNEDFTHWTKEACFIIDTSLLEVKHIAEEVFKSFGSYDLVSNNCQRFASLLLERLRALQVPHVEIPKSLQGVHDSVAYIESRKGSYKPCNNDERKLPSRSVGMQQLQRAPARQMGTQGE